jgi:hypothetical protein
LTLTSLPVGEIPHPTVYKSEKYSSLWIAKSTRHDKKDTCAVLSLSHGSFNGQGLIALFPNPAGNDVTLTYTDANLRGTTATITDLHGRKMMRLTVTKDRQTIDISILPTGLYYLHLANGACLKLMKL